MGCHARTAEEKAERFPGAKAEVSWPYTCADFPSLQALAKELQNTAGWWKGATIVGGKIFAFTSCAVITGPNVCDN